MAQGLDGSLQRGLARDEDDAWGLRERLEVGQELHAVAVGQAEVEEHGIRRGAGDVGTGLGEGAGRGDFEAFPADGFREADSEAEIVVDDEGTCHESPSASRNRRDSPATDGKGFPFVFAWAR